MLITPSDTANNPVIHHNDIPSRYTQIRQCFFIHFVLIFGTNGNKFKFPHNAAILHPRPSSFHWLISSERYNYKKIFFR